MVSQKEFFKLLWNNCVISFPQEGKIEDEVWTLGVKIGEKKIQQQQTATDLNSNPSTALATFECFNAKHRSNGIIRIFMQIPHTGSESEPWESRAKQASEALPDCVTAELASLIKLKNGGCVSAPKLLDWKIGKQSQAMPVPGGYVVFILTDDLPGQILTNFTKKSSYERRLIMMAFREAYLDCYECGAVSDKKRKNNVIWDEKQRKCYIVDFTNSHTPTCGDRWRSEIWKEWGFPTSTRSQGWFSLPLDDLPCSGFFEKTGLKKVS